MKLDRFIRLTVAVLVKRVDLNDLRRQAGHLLDRAKRREMYVEMQQLIRDEGGFVCPVFKNWLVATSDKVYVPEKIGGDAPVDGNRNAERWWFA